MSHLSGGRIQLDPATKPTLPSEATLATINDQPASPAATYVLGILYDMDLYGGQQYTLTYTNHCSTSYTVQWASMPAFDNRTTSAKTADNCHHGTLYWDVSFGLPSYPFTNAVSNVGTTFNDKTSSANRALRGVGARWTRILWRCWINRNTYDPDRHLKNQPAAITA